MSFLTFKQLPTYSSIRLQTLYTNHEWSYQTRRAQDIPTSFIKMLSLELEYILDDNMDKADKANVSTIVRDFKIMDKADVADVCVCELDLQSGWAALITWCQPQG
jgi:hypothetical protein